MTVQALTSLGYSKLTDAEVNELFAEADTDHSGTIDFNGTRRLQASLPAITLDCVSASSL